MVCVAVLGILNGLFPYQLKFSIMMLKLWYNKNAQFTNFEVDVDNEESDDGKEVSDDSDLDSLKSFIENEQVHDDDVNFYRDFDNIETDIEQTLKEEYGTGLEDIENFEEISNLCKGSEDELEIDDFKNAKEKIVSFNEMLFPNTHDKNNRLINVLLLVIRFDKVGKTNVCDQNEFKENIDSNLIKELNEGNFTFILDLQKFNNICYEINLILSKHNYFLRIFELKDKYRQLSMKEPKKQNIIRQLSSCLIEKYNGFQVISIEFDRKQKKKFKPIDIIYKPTKNPEIELLCYFSKDIAKAYSNFYSIKDKTKRAYSCYECYYCRKFFLRPERQKRHMENCSGVPGVIYNFNTQSLISFEDNFHAKGNLPFVIYFDFETTAPTDNCFDPEQKTMFVVSYVMIVAFHPDLKIDKIIIQRSYAHAIEQLTSLDYFSQDQIKFINKELVRQLKDIAFDVSKRKCKKTMGQMLCVECGLVKKTLLEWFNRKFESQYLKISPFDEFRYERNFPIDWQNDKCVICKFPLKVEPTNYQTPDDEMTFGDFIIRYEHKFLRNIYTKEQINYSSDIKDLQSYYETFQKFIHISICLISMLNHYNTNDTVNYEVQEFIQDIFNDDSINDIKNHIMKTEIKNTLSISY